MIRRTQTLQSRLSRRLEREPTRPTLTFVDRQGQFQWKTFAEVYEEAMRSGAALVERGLRPGDVCVLVLHSDPFCATALMSICWAILPNSGEKPLNLVCLFRVCVIVIQFIFP